MGDCRERAKTWSPAPPLFLSPTQSSTKGAKGNSHLLLPGSLLLRGDYPCSHLALLQDQMGTAPGCPGRKARGMLQLRGPLQPLC